MGLFDKLKKENKEEKQRFNEYYGGFVVSKNIYKHKVKWSYREESSLPGLNGWTIYSEIDDDEYVNDPDNFEIVSAETLFKYCPAFQAIYEAPYGTDLTWMYEKGVLVGFWDMKKDRETTIEEIVAGMTTNDGKH